MVSSSERFAIHPAEGSAAERRMRDRRFVTWHSAMTAAEEAAAETQEPVSVEAYEAHDDDITTTRTWTVRHDAPTPTEAQVD